MLETMQTELTKEKEADQELYDKLSCWSAGGSRSCCSRAGMVFLEASVQHQKHQEGVGAPDHYSA